MTTSSDQFTDLFCTALPLGLRDEAAGMTARDAFTRYSHATGPLRLGNWRYRGRAGRGPQVFSYQATIADGDRVATSAVTASGPVGALTAMLHERGIAVEMLKFHQLRSGAHTATFIRGADGSRELWAMGWSEDPTDSALRAIIACANRLAEAAA